MPEDPRIASLRAQGVPIPVDTWRIGHMGRDPKHSSLWVLELVKIKPPLDEIGAEREHERVRVEAASLPEAMSRLKIAMRHANMSILERHQMIFDDIRAEAVAQPEARKRASSCDMCNAGMHGLCTDTRSGYTNAAGCECWIARPATADQHPPRR